MTTTDYLIDIGLILVVLKTMREGHFGLRSVLLPIGLLTFAVSHYLTSLPTSGHDLELYAALTAVGVTVGTLSGLATHLRLGDDSLLLARTGIVAAALWVLGMGARMAFSLYANGSGADAVIHFSIVHEITGAGAWTAALILMAAGQVIAKFGVQFIRGHHLMHQVPVAALRPVTAA